MCFEKRKSPVKIMCCCSFFAALFGILMIVFAFLLTGNSMLENMEKEDESIEDVRKLIFTILLIFSLVTIVIASLGFCFTWCKHRCFVCMYGIILLPTWIFVLVVGTIATLASVTATENIEEQCLIYADYGTNVELDENTSIKITLDIYVSLGIDEYMCSRSCPCIEVDTKDQWYSDPPVDREDSSANPLVIGLDTYTLPYFSSYQDCIEEKSKDIYQNGDSFNAFAMAFKSQSSYDEIMKWIKFFEDEYDCAGICFPAAFSFSKSIENGRPTKACLNSIKDDLNTAFLGLAITTLLAGIFLFFIFIIQYCLWKKY